MHAFSWKQFHVCQGGSFTNNNAVDLYFDMHKKYTLKMCFWTLGNRLCLPIKPRRMHYFVYVCLCGAHICICEVCLYGPEVNSVCLSWTLSTLYNEPGSLWAQSSSFQLVWIASLLWGFCFCLLNAGITGSLPCPPDFLSGSYGSELWTSGLYSKHFTH